MASSTTVASHYHGDYTSKTPGLEAQSLLRVALRSGAKSWIVSFRSLLNNFFSAAQKKLLSDNHRLSLIRYSYYKNHFTCTVAVGRGRLNTPPHKAVCISVHQTSFPCISWKFGPPGNSAKVAFLSSKNGKTQPFFNILTWKFSACSSRSSPSDIFRLLKTQQFGCEVLENTSLISDFHYFHQI